MAREHKNTKRFQLKTNGKTPPKALRDKNRRMLQENDIDVEYLHLPEVIGEGSRMHEPHFAPCG